MKVSVIIPVYNALDYLEECVRSALEQEETGEVILIEDNSPDNCLPLCRSLEEGSPRVRVLRHPGGENRGASASRNLGIRSAEYDLVAFLDADDYYLPGRFRLTAGIFDDNPGIDGVYEATGICFEDAGAKGRWEALGARDLTMLHEVVPPEELCDVLIGGGRGDFHLNGLTVRKDVFRRCGYFPEDLHMHEDTLLMNKMAHYARLLPGSLDTPVAVRRVHEANRYVAEFNTYRTRYDLWKRMFRWALESDPGPERTASIFLNYVFCTWAVASDRYSEGSKSPGKMVEFVLAVMGHPLLSLRALREHLRRKRRQ